MLIQELRGEIGQALSSTIEIRRNSLLVMGRNIERESFLVSESEIDDFLISNPLYDQSVVQALLLPPGLNPASISINVGKVWLADFRQATSEWVGTNSWLGADEPWAPVGIQITRPSEPRELWIPNQPLIAKSFPSAPTTLAIATRLIREGKDLAELNWRQFEELIADLLDAEGWSVQLTSPIGDGGIDVLAARDDAVVGPILTVWQAKRYSKHRKVGISTIRELIAVRDEHQASKAFVVTTSSFTNGALMRIAQEHYKLGAVDGPDLAFWVRQVTGL